MLPIAYDWQHASALPENPDVSKMLALALLLGGLETCFSLLWAYAANQTNWFDGNLDIFSCTREAQSGVWVQMSIAAELLIFSARAPSFIFTSISPSPALFISVIIGCVIVSVFAGQIDFFGGISAKDIAIIWTYDIICLFIIDYCKVLFYKLIEESTDVLVDRTHEPDEEITTDVIYVEPTIKDIEHGGNFKHVKTHQFDDNDDAKSDRSSAVTSRLQNWNATANANVNFSIGADPNEIIGDASRSMSSSNIFAIRKGSNAAIAAKRSLSSTPQQMRIQHVTADQQPELSSTYGTAGILETDVSTLAGGTISMPQSYAQQGSSINLRRTNLSSTNLRPYTPANNVVGKKFK
jgi:hypothetical protein